MPTMTTLYHPEYEPTTVDAEKVSLEQMADQGWCDSPMKTGRPLRGGEERRAAAMAMKSLVEQGKIPRIESPTPVSKMLAEEMEKQAAAAQQKAAEKEATEAGMRTTPSAEQEAKEAAEKEADTRSDAAKRSGESRPRKPKATAQQNSANDASDF